MDMRMAETWRYKGTVGVDDVGATGAGVAHVRSISDIAGRRVNNDGCGTSTL